MIEAIPDQDSRPVGASLDHHETNVGSTGNVAEGDLAAQDRVSQAFRHSGWRILRWRTRLAIRTVSDSKKRLERFDGCGSYAWVQRDRSNPKRLRLSCNRCRDRFCQPCARERGHQLALAIRDRLAGKPHRLITLTLANNNEPLVVTLRRLAACFSRLRRSKLWSKSVNGGVALTEVKLGKKSGKWHAHLHIVAEGRYIDQACLADAWKKITGDSFVVDIRLIRNDEQAARYVTKYVTKPIDASITRGEEPLVEAVAALSGRRMFTTFGTWHGDALEPETEPGDWETIGSFGKYLIAARLGDAEAAAILHLLGDFEQWTPPRAPPGSRTDDVLPRLAIP